MLRCAKGEIWMAFLDFLRTSEYKRIIDEQNQKLQEQEATLSEQSGTIAELKGTLATYTQMLAEQKDIIATQAQELAEQQECIATQKQKLAEQAAVLTDEHGMLIDVKKLLGVLEEQRIRLETIILLKKIAIAKAEDQVLQLKAQTVELEEIALLQDFGLYKPTYDFATSTMYKETLERNREKQKQMIKEKTAAICKTTWSVNNSRREGRKMTNDNIKQVLLTFNTECENVIDKVKFNNFDSMKKRIQRIYDKLNALNASLNISISPTYLELKMQELTLAYEYAVKKQEEKEFAREQREIQRENARVQKELENERHRIEKEQAHYQNQMQRLSEQMEVEEDSARKDLIAEKIAAIKDELIDLDKALKDVDYRQANERAGYVYVISNIGSFGEGIYKIGMTRRLDPMDRVDELGGASVPFRFDVHALIFSVDAPKLETALHNAFADRRVNMVNGRKEFFRVSLREIEEVVTKNHDRTVEFKDTAIAQQYRETLKMRTGG